MRPRSICASILGLTASALFLLPSTAQAQTTWENPMLIAPGTPAGFGAHVFDPAGGGGVGFLGTWRGSSTPAGMGFRIGLVEAPSEDLSVNVGIDIGGGLVVDSEVPIDLMWFSGVGIAGEGSVLSVPLGLAAAYRLDTDGIGVMPWLAPRMVLDAALSDDASGDRLDLGLSLELGVDLNFGRSWALRTSGSLGDREGISIGLLIPGE